MDFFKFKGRFLSNLYVYRSKPINVKALFITTLLFASTAMYAQTGVGATETCDCEEYSDPADHCQLILCQPLKGTVTNDGTPVNCACVRVLRGETLLHATKTDAEGKWEISNMPMGIFTIEYIKDGTTHQINNVKMKADEATDVSADLNTLPAESEYSTSSY